MSNFTDFTFSIREKQAAAVRGFLRSARTPFSSANTSNSTDFDVSVWKVVVFDDFCCDILALLLRKGEFRRLGVTLTLNIKNDRKTIPDAPAIYFVSPTKENIQRICLDCGKGLYHSFYLNASTSFPTDLLELLAKETVESNSVHRIQRVYDQFISFLSLEEDLFVTHNIENSFSSFHDESISDSSGEFLINEIAVSLFSVLLTLQVLPIIRAPRNTSAEMVAVKLNEMLRNHITNNPTMTASYAFFRPLLVIVDRNIDLSVMVTHPWTYQALIHELLDYKLNRAKMYDKEQHKECVYDLDDRVHSGWGNCRGLTLPDVATLIRTEVSSYRETCDEIGKYSSNANGIDIGALQENDLSEKGLSQFVGRLPQLRDQKLFIDMHTTIGTCIMEEIKNRSLDSFLNLEESLLTKSTLDVKELTQIFENESEVLKEEKIRLLCLTCLHPRIKREELDKFTQILTSQGIDLLPYYQFKKYHTIQTELVTLTSSEKPKMSQSSSWGFSSVFGKVAEGIRNWLPKIREFPLTRIVDSLMTQNGKGGLDEEYVYLDPKISSSSSSSIPRKTTPFRETIVFVIGGGNYTEYQNLIDHFKPSVSTASGTIPVSSSPGPNASQTHGHRRVIYGTTEMLNGTQFLQQLSIVAEKEKS